jgi:alpha-L-fucosidase
MQRSMTGGGFGSARYGMMIQYGLYSMLERGEWVLNREHIPVEEYKKLAGQFMADKLDFDELLRRAKNDWGMRYAVLCCKHHEGFCLYDSKLTEFTSLNSRCGRDLTAEFVAACRKHDMGIGLYHSLNDWTHTPNAVDALERPEECYQPFIDFTHGQIREILSNYGKIDLLWYDGWWPFDGAGWQAEKLNAMARELQPGILVNGRCGIPGDFDTPEGHVSVSKEGQLWEVYLNLNESGGYHKGDHNWKSAKDIAEVLRQCAAGQGNLLLNLAPKGDGSIPQLWEDCVEKVGRWLKENNEAVFTDQRFMMSLHRRQGALSEWTHHGRFSGTKDRFYWHIRNWPGSPLRLVGVECEITGVSELATGRSFNFRQTGNIVEVDAPEQMDTDMPVVLRFLVKGEARLYNCGGYNIPAVDHCRYDPLPSDLAEIP